MLEILWWQILVDPPQASGFLHSVCLLVLPRPKPSNTPFSSLLFLFPTGKSHLLAQWLVPCNVYLLGEDPTTKVSQSHTFLKTPPPYSPCEKVLWSLMSAVLINGHDKSREKTLPMSGSTLSVTLNHRESSWAQCPKWHEPWMDNSLDFLGHSVSSALRWSPCKSYLTMKTIQQVRKEETQQSNDSKRTHKKHEAHLRSPTAHNSWPCNPSVNHTQRACSRRPH